MIIKYKQKKDDAIVQTTDKDIKDQYIKINSCSPFNLSLFFNSYKLKL